MLKLLKTHWILLLSLFLLVLMVIPLLYFGNLFRMLDNRSGSLVDPEADSGQVMGICLNNLTESRSMREKEVFLSEARNQKVSVQIRVAHYSLERQIRQIRSFIREKVSVLIVAPVCKSGLADVLQEAAAKGIKIILYDELTEGPVDLYCGLDYREIGKMQASYLAKKVGRGHYLVLKGPDNSYKANQIAKGQSDTLKKMAKLGVKLLIEDAPPRWSPEEVALKARTLMMHQKINAILTPNDICAEEIIKLFKGQDLDLPYLAGVGGERAAIYNIISRKLIITVTSDYDALAKAAFHHGLKLASGEGFVSSDAINYNLKKIPALLLPVHPITEANIDLLLKNANY